MDNGFSFMKLAYWTKLCQNWERGAMIEVSVEIDVLKKRAFV